MKLFSKHAIFILLGCSVSLFALDVTPEFKIVSKDLRGKVDQEAVKVLSDHLAKIFGKVPGTANVPGTEKTIVLSGDNSLNDEEWIIRSDGKNLYISGGNPRGLYYGVCEFLEKFAGVKYFTKSDIKAFQTFFKQVALISSHHHDVLYTSFLKVHHNSLGYGKITDGHHLLKLFHAGGHACRCNYSSDSHSLVSFPTSSLICSSSSLV